MLSHMVAKLFADSPLTMLSTVAMAIFMGVFLAVTVSVLRRRASAYDEIARLPLADDEEVHHDR